MPHAAQSVKRKQGREIRMNDFILQGDPPVRIILRRTAAARRYSLRVSRLDGRVTLTMPKRASEARALAFARDKATWIHQKLSERPQEVAVDLGTSLPVSGRNLDIVQGPRSRIDFEGGRIEISQRASSVPRAVYGLLRTAAREELATASHAFSQRLGRAYAGITVRDTRSRWGSCSAEGALMYSWRLILAPPEVLSYVCAHEVAHLEQMNHSPRFWAAVERLWPDYREHRAWLRHHGETLHRYRFLETT